MRGDRAAGRALVYYGYAASAKKAEPILDRAAALGAFSRNETSVDGYLASPTWIIAADGDPVAPADVGCALAERIGATCRRLEDLTLRHEALMVPSEPVLEAVLEALAVSTAPDFRGQ